LHEWQGNADSAVVILKRFKDKPTQQDSAAVLAGCGWPSDIKVERALWLGEERPLIPECPAP
jgi:hypothetical protein